VAAVARAARYGGGPGAMEDDLRCLTADWRGRRAEARAQAGRWSAAAAALEEAVARVRDAERTA
jgi:hypothetical protein